MMDRAARQKRLEEIRKDYTIGAAARLGQQELNERIGFLLEIYDGLRGHCRTLQEALAKDYAANAAIQLQDMRFRQFLCHRLGGSTPEDVTFCEHRLKTHLGIKSKKELNASAEARDKWLALVREFNQWKRNG